MPIYYSKTSNAFFVEGVNANIPADKVEIPEDVWQHILSAQCPTAQLSADASGNPILIDPSAENAVIYTSVGQT